MKISKRNNNKGFTISELIVVLVIVLIAGILLFPLIRYSGERMERTVCTNNMREVGLALYIYAAEHEGNFPPSLKALYDEKYLAKEDLVDCPASKDKGTPENPDYIYTAGLSVRSPSNSVLVGEEDMKEIGLALYIYAAEHGGNFPASLKELYDGKYLNDEYHPPVKKKGEVEEGGPLPVEEPETKSSPNSILLRDKEKNHSSGWKNVMEVNGKITGA
ncbi:MAG: prepilin-type N-terminal cleavage/methylation domain-containing protein [Candidatus Aadella gelida]|nr:prepilin-type N-terminal cleavage/methylation domain-containing protein [Candidatus Aadella gelida]